jgi:ABC-type sulfate/molybdate transport systems ATPase subunit
VKADLRVEFRAALRALGTAAIHVTHDREEGLFLGDRVGLLFDGRLTCVGPPAEVFGAPRDVRSARFLGYNVLRDGSEWVAVDPHDLHFDELSTGARPVTVEGMGRVGRDTLIVVRGEEGGRFEMRGPAPSADLAPGDRVGIRWSRSVPLAATD